MIDIINMYGIPHKNSKMSCPFHGIDKHPSAKIYETNFHCFTCLKHLDVIGFVEEYFNLPFKDAMKKINYDFNMGLDSNYVDYDRLRKLKNIQNEKKKQKQKLIKKYSELCDIKHCYESIINDFKSKINVNNWERLTDIISYFQTKTDKINENLNYIDNILSSRN